MEHFNYKKSSEGWRLSCASLLALILVLGVAAHSAAVEFPYRKDYPTTPTIESESLFKEYEVDKIIIVDVRSEIEYDVIHPEGAVHLPLSSANFIENVKELRSFNPDKKLAFYCNGITCLKSYEATKKALAAGIGDCYVYDAGIPMWASIYPEKTLLLGKELVDPDKQLIAKADFKKKCLPFKKFKSTTKSKKRPGHRRPGSHPACRKN